MATSTTENEWLKHSKAPMARSAFRVYERPHWPYEEWNYVTKEDPANVVSDLQDLSDDNDTSKETSLDVIKAPIDLCAKTNDNPIIDGNESRPRNGEEKIDGDDTSCHEMSSDDSELYAPDHWIDDNLFEDVSDDLPLSHLLSCMEPMLLKYEDDETKEIAHSMNEMMNNIAAKVASSYDVFKDCWVIPVGSVIENTKIDKADEFDFAVVLPVFEQVDGLFDTLFEKDDEKMLNDPNLRAFAKDMLNEDGDVTNAVEHFQALLKQVWSFYMEDFAPAGWTVLETFCYGDEISIAGTFHLKRLSDGFAVDVDLCFLAPIHEDALRKSDLIEQKEFILENCLDEDNKVYAILSKDHSINYSVNIVRFAMSVKERELLNRYGEDNGRIKCYKFSKCFAKLFLPKTNKRQDCDRCLESLVSSFCLKNIVLYMMHNYPSDAKWTNEQLANRIIEVFQILNFSLKVNCGIISAYFLPYLITVTSELTYDPETRTVSDEGMAWLGDDVPSVPCFLPDLDKVIELFGEDHITRRILENYRDFLSLSRWSSPEVIDRLVEVLGTLRETCEESRKEIAENPGSTCFQLNAGGDIPTISAELT